MKASITLIILALLACGCGIKRDFVRMKEQIAALEAGQKRLEQKAAGQDSLDRAQGESIKALQAMPENPARGYRPLAPPPSPGDVRVDALPLGAADPDQPKRDFKQAYDTAYLDVTKGNYDQAAAAFRDFLRDFPQSSLADNAQYWIGECLYAQKRFTEAAAEFNRVIDKYPNQDKVPAALYKAGVCYAELKEPGKAREAWDKLLKKYPKSPEAGLARQRGAGN